MKTPPGRAFSIQNDAIVWEKESVPTTAERFLNQSTEQKTLRLDEEEFSELSRAANWLKSRLSGSRVLSNVVRAEAMENEVSEATLRRAYLLLGCKKGKETRANGQWYWRLPGREAIPVSTNLIEVDRTLVNLLEVAHGEKSPGDKETQ